MVEEAHFQLEVLRRGAFGGDMEHGVAGLGLAVLPQAEFGVVQWHGDVALAELVHVVFVVSVSDRRGVTRVARLDQLKEAGLPWPPTD